MDKKSAREEIRRILNKGGRGAISISGKHPKMRAVERKFTVQDALRIIMGGTMKKDPVDHKLGFECVVCGKKMTETHIDYHYVESGLDNVYLIGVSQFECKDCGEVEVRIPDPIVLHIILAISISMKEGLLEGPEIRFMRKEIGMSAKAFAEMICVSPVTLSNWETGEMRPKPSSDQLIRYAFKSMMQHRFSTLISTMEDQVQKSETVRREKNRIDIDTDHMKYISIPRAEYAA